MVIQALGKDDENLVWEFLPVAAHEETVPAVQTMPELARYSVGWGRGGDFGFRVMRDGLTIGLVWARLFSVEDGGYGWLSAEIPELALAVQPPFRGQGVGRMLMERLIEAARGKHAALSLNVRSDNSAAIRLYESLGFVVVPGSKTANRVGGVSMTLRLDL